MKTRRLFVVVASALVGAATTASLQSSAQHEGHQMQEHSHSYTGGSLQLHKIMEAGSAKMMDMKLSNNTDTDFAMLMAEHHAQAIKMVDVELKYGKVAALKF